MSLILPFSIYNNITFTSTVLDISGSVYDLMFYSPNKFVFVGAMSSINSTPVSSISFLNSNYSFNNSYNEISAFIDENNPIIKIKEKTDGNFFAMRFLPDDSTLYSITPSANSISAFPNPFFNSNINDFIIDTRTGQNNNIIVGGAFGSVGGNIRYNLAKLNGTDGSLDATFLGGLDLFQPFAPSPQVYVIKEDTTFEFSNPNDTIIIGGSFDYIRVTSTTRIDRKSVIRLLKSDGYYSPSLNFNASLSGDAIIYDIDIYDTDPLDFFFGNILIGGYFGKSPDYYHLSILNSNGSAMILFKHNIPDLSFVKKCKYIRYGNSNKRKVVASVIDNSLNCKLYRLNTDGTIDILFNNPKGYLSITPQPSTNPGDEISSITEDMSNGNIIITGKFQEIEGKPRTGIAIIDTYGNVL